MKKIFFVATAILWSSVSLAKLVGFARGHVATRYNTKIPLRVMGLSNRQLFPICANSTLCGSLFSPETNGSISYRLTARDGSWQRVFSVELSEQADSRGRYVVYRRYGRGERATRVKLEGYFQYHDEHRAELTYRDRDNSLINILFFKPPPSENENRTLRVKTEVRSHRGRLLLDIFDIMKHDKTAE